MTKKDKKLDTEPGAVLGVEPNPISKPENVGINDLVENEVFPEKNPEAIEATKKREAETTAEVSAAEPAKKKRGRPAGVKNGLKKPGQAVSPSDAPSSIQISSAAAATVVSGILERLAVTSIGSDFTYTELERGSNVTAWEKTFDHYGGVNLSPPAALALDYAGIIMARLPSKQTQSKIQLAGAWLKNKFSRKKNNARIDNRQDTERKDNPSEEKKPGDTT